MRPSKSLFLVAAFLLTSTFCQPLAAQNESLRAKMMIGAEVVFQPSVFSGNRFPKCDFLKPGIYKELLGKYEINTSFYNKDYEEVEQPKAPGRYGAIVTIKAEDGKTYTRFRTLYKTPATFRPFFGSVQGSTTLPPTTGIDTSTWKKQNEAFNNYLTFAISRDVQRSHELAILLAGLSELDNQSPKMNQVTSAVSKDREWWLVLKRKLNGNGKRFAKPFVGPVAGERKARTLVKGSAKEAGMKADAVEKIDAILKQWSADSDQPFNACVARKGVLFFNKAYGSRDGKPITTETRHVVFSISKALSGSLLMMFVDQGIVKLNDPVEKFLPEFSGEGVATSATLHHLFCHCADMDGHFTDFQSDLEHVYGEAYQHLKVGKQHRYNGTSIGIGLKVLEQISGKTLPNLYKEHLFDPLGCESIESIDGSAMTWSNAKDLAIIGQMMANRGSYGDKKFFGEATFKQMLPRKLSHLLGDDTRVVWGVGLTWFREGGFSKQTIGHGSASSCTLRIDLENDLVVTMTRATAGKNFNKYHPKFIRTIIDSIEK